MLLAIDLGSSGVKAAAISLRGETLRSAHTPVAVRRVGLATEVDPREWAAAVRSSVCAVLAGQPGRPEGCVLTGQMGSWVWVDETGEPVGSAVSWNDGRLARLQGEVLLPGGADAYYAATGQRLPALPAVMALARQHGRSGRPLMLRAWLTQLLVGQAYTDPTDACITGCFAIGPRQWWPMAKQSWSLPDGVLPPVAEPTAVVGRVTAAAEAQLGVPAGTPVIAGAGDGPCASVGSGAVADGEACLTLGSSGTLRLMVSRPLLDRDRRSTCLAFTEQLWIAMAATSNVGYALDWARTALGYRDFAELEADAASAPPGSGGLIFLPYLVGERFPLWEGRLRGGFYGLDPDHTHAHMARAVFEGLALSLRQAQVHFTALGVRPQRVVINGGGARSGLLTSLIAQALGVPCRVSEREALTGAAMLAAVGLGIYPTLADAVAAMGGTAPPVAAAEGDSRILELAYNRQVALSRAVTELIRTGDLPDGDLE